MGRDLSGQDEHPGYDASGAGIGQNPPCGYVRRAGGLRRRAVRPRRRHGAGRRAAIVRRRGFRLRACRTARGGVVRRDAAARTGRRRPCTWSADGVPGGLEAVGPMSDDEIDAVIARTLAQQAACGVTTVRDLGDRGYRTLGFRDAAAARACRASSPPGRRSRSPDGHCHYLGGVAEGPEAIRAAMAEHVDRGVDVVKVMASRRDTDARHRPAGVQFSPEDLVLIVALAARRRATGRRARPLGARRLARGRGRVTGSSTSPA